MYRVETDDQARDAIAALPAEELVGYAEVLDLLEVEPWAGQPLRADTPDANILTLPFGSAGMVTYMVLDREQEVHVLRVQWAGSD